MKTRTSRKVALEEDIKHVLEELWDAEEEEPLTKSSRDNSWEQKAFRRCCDTLRQSFMTSHVETTKILSSVSKSMKQETRA